MTHILRRGYRSGGRTCLTASGGLRSEFRSKCFYDNSSVFLRPGVGAWGGDVAVVDSSLPHPWANKTSLSGAQMIPSHAPL